MKKSIQTPEEVTTQETQLPKMPTNLSEMKEHLESKVKEVQDTFAIIHMANSDLHKSVDKFTSLTKLKKYSHKVIDKDIDLARSLATYALEALSIAIKVTEVVSSKDPRTVVSEEAVSEGQVQ